jgi:16S rRNA (cytidine1402-2'-O)-methyltransferase
MPLAVCATPIGNLEDVTLRVLRELREADVILCEDTRRTRQLLGRYDIEGKALLSYHEHNEQERTRELLPRLQAGERIALVSDAGLPGISDPGSPLILAAREAGVPVTVLPGPSAVETALVTSGRSEGPYVFVGFLPRREQERRALWEELAELGLAAVAFESPKRLAAALRSLATHSPDAHVVVCRELTKLHEEIVSGSARYVATQYADVDPRGEITLVVSGVAAPTTDEHEAVEAVAELVAAGVPRKQAAALVARLTGVPRNRLYEAGLDSGPPQA